MKGTPEFQVFKESLLAATRGPFFPDAEFHSLFGLERAEVESIADSLTSTTPLTGDAALAINNAMGNLLGYPHGQDAVWSQWLSVTPEELQVIFSQWRALGIEA